MKTELVPLDRLMPDANNPRKAIDAESLKSLATSILRNGIKTPLIGFTVPGGVALVDGHCRMDAARSVGLAEVPVTVFPHRPSETELLITQLTINTHRHSLTPIDEYEAFSRLAKLKNWTPSEIAESLAVSNAEVTRVFSIGKLTPEELQLVRDGKLSKSAAYALTRLSPEQRAEMAQRAATGEVTRDQLNVQARRKKSSSEVKARQINCPVTGGSVSVRSPDGLDLPGLIELLESLVRECRKARSQGLDISTAVRVLRDRCRPSTAV